MALSSYIRFLVGAIACWSTVLFMTELIKGLGGRPRPDFLDRCQPTQAAEGAPLDTLYLEFGSAKYLTCTGSSEDVYDGRMSFPSGHSSTAYIVGW
jgi:diacylglycerol diphosphate phosphatase/phosphatidate phosphatase